MIASITSQATSRPRPTRPPPERPEIEALKKELDQAQGQFNYCAAADFQSPEERAGESSAYRRIHEIQGQLARARGKDFITDDKLKVLVAAIYQTHPIAALGVDVARQVYQACHHEPFPLLGVTLGGAPDDTPSQIASALQQGVISQQEVDDRVCRLISRRVARPKHPDAEKIQQEATSIAVSPFRDKHPVYPDLDGFLAAAATQHSDRSSSLLGTVLHLAADERIELSPEKLNAQHDGPYVYQQGMLASRVADYEKWRSQGDAWSQKSNAQYGISRMEDLLQQNLPFGAEERRQALDAAAGFLAERVRTCPADRYAVDWLSQDLERWAGYGLDAARVAELKAALPASKEAPAAL